MRKRPDPHPHVTALLERADWLCAECVHGFMNGERGDSEVSLAYVECEICHGGACEMHAKRYNTAHIEWAHETCWEGMD